MERNQLLKALKEITFAAFITWLPTEMCLELRTMTSSGPNYTWIGEDDWNVFCLRPCERETWNTIREKISDNELNLSDIKATDYGRLVEGVFNDIEEKDCSSLLKELSEERFLDPGEYYCYYNSEDGSLDFFATEKEMELALANIYSYDDSPWEELDTETLRYWLDLYEEEGGSIPCNFFEDDE